MEAKLPPKHNMEDVLHHINSQCVTLPKDIKQTNMKILRQVVNTFLGKMTQDPLLKKLYKRIFYGGSYYEGMKVGNPDEYDLDILLVLPKQLHYDLLNVGDHPGFVKVKIHNPELLGAQFQQKLVQDGYMCAHNLRCWMQSIVMTVLGKFHNQNGYFHFSAGSYLLKGKMRNSSPAMTLEVSYMDGKFLLNIDMVPCFEFDWDKLPADNWRTNPVPSKSTFFIVPKRPKNLSDLPDIYWRLSFQEQERILLWNKRNLKPVLRLLKRMRDVLGHNSVASYYLKTVFLWTNEIYGDTYWNGNLSGVFLKMLREYVSYLNVGKITYFWNRQLNLLPAEQRTEEVKNQLDKILRNIERNSITNPKVICEYFGCTA